MNVLMITPRFTEHAGGDGLYAFHLVRGLRGAGHHVHVLTIRNGRFVLLTMEGGNETTAEFGTAGGDALSEHYHSAAAADALRRTFERHQPDVVHIHGIHQYFTAACVPVLRRARVPVVFTVHDYKLVCGNAGFFSDRTGEQCTACLTGTLWNPVTERCKRGSFVQSTAAAVQMQLWSLRGFLELVTAVHAPSRFVGTLLERHPILRGKIFTERHPLLFAPGPVPEPTGQPTVLFFGRLVPHKGGHLAVEAMRGSGSDPSIRFLGWKTQSEIRSMMGPDTIALLPYLAPETFCFAVLEAMMEGCAVVTSARGAIPELVQHGVNGIVVDPPDAAGFRRAVELLLSDTALRQRLSDAARRAGEGLLSVHDHAVRMAGHYHSIITSPRTSEVQ
ncbi:MAG: glycosyltransferase family 4 protein [Bacteroidetes bacterium]|nr:glycosyltransferase family 4 protein [Bacteroidota bacterium]